jgi:molybdate-binding protein/predicted nucleic acid-binding protein
MTEPRFLFDTHVCLHLIRSGVGELRTLFGGCAPGDIAISSLTLAALRARAQNSRSPEQNRRALEQFVLPLLVVDFDAEAAAWLGKLAARAELRGQAAGPEEMLAAQALRLRAELVTSRPELYAGVEELALRSVLPDKLEDRPADQPRHRRSETPGGSTVDRQVAASAARIAPGSPAPALGPRVIHMAGSHDFTLDLLAGWLHKQDPDLSLALHSVGSLRGLLSLQENTAHLAPSHLLDEETGDYNRGYIQHLLTPLGVRVLLMGFVEREQGLIVRKGNPKDIRSLLDLTRPDVTYVNRQRGAGTRVLLDYQLRRQGVASEQVRGYDRQEPTHLAVAAAVADGRADCGLGVPAAARTLGLDFVPLFHERFDLVIPIVHYESALLRPLVELLRQPEAGFLEQVAALGGYETGLMGRVLAEL